MNAVVIPAYEPEKGLEKITENLRDLGYIVILVDDGSGSAYAPLFDKLSEECIVLRHKENKGKGAAIKTALSYIAKELWDCDVVGTMDADGQHLPEDMERVFQEAHKNPDTLILGAREVGKEMPAKSRIGNSLTRTAFRAFYGLSLTDTQTGLRAFPVSMIPWMRGIEGDRYEYEMKVLIEAAKEKIPVREVRIHTIYHDRGNSCSHFHVFRDSFRIWKELVRFAVSSLSSFAVDYVLFSLFAACLFRGKQMYWAANLFARMFSAVYNYKMNCHLVFQTGESRSSFAEYAALAAGILFLDSIILGILNGIVGVPVYAAKIMTECVMFFFSWTFQRRIIFKKGAKQYGMGI